MSNKDLLTEMTIKLLNENFRDYDSEINKIEDKLDDLITSVHTFDRVDNLLEYEFDDAFYEEDKIIGQNLQKQLKDLYDRQQAEYENEVKQLPTRTTKTDFEGFDITKTDPIFDSYMLEGSPDREYYMKKKGFTDVYIAEMTPEEYLLLCGKYGWKNTFTNIDDIIKYTPEKNLIHEYADMFRQGYKAPMPVLNVKYLTQEGRHRALAAMEVGIKTIPVLIEI